MAASMRENGGPGVSSVLGLLEENGPFVLDTEGSGVVSNPYSWNSNATVIYVDSPVGVGFGHADTRDYPQTEIENTPRMVEFFTTLMQIRPELATLDLYLFGESYAGHFVPFIAVGLLKSQNPQFNLKGIGLGNTLMSVATQYPEYPNFAYAPENRKYTNTTEEAFISTTKQFNACRASLRFVSGFVRDSVQRNFCQNIYAQLVQDSEGNDKFDVFDIRNPPVSRTLSASRLGDTEEFMNRPSVLNELKSDKLFAEQTAGYFDIMTRRDWATDASNSIAELLDGQVKVLAYHGIWDFICNWMGGLATLRQLPWSKKDEFNAALPSDYHGYGEMTQYGNLQFLAFYDAGHMVPKDQPAHSLDMVIRFIEIPTTLSIRKLGLSSICHNYC